MDFHAGRRTFTQGGGPSAGGQSRNREEESLEAGGEAVQSGGVHEGLSLLEGGYRVNCDVAEGLRSHGGDDVSLAVVR